MKSSPFYGIIGSTKTRMRCLFCGVFIPKANKCIEEHTNGTKHRECIEQVFEHGIVYNNEELFCRPCDLHFGENDSVASHIENVTHTNWIATLRDLTFGEFVDIEPYLASESDEVTCEACDCKIHCKLQAIEDHVNDIWHRINVANKLKPLNGIFTTETGEEAWCKVCNAYFDNSSQAILNHIDTARSHGDWFMGLIELIQAQYVSVQEYLRLEKEKNAYCIKCLVEFPCNLQNLEEHVFSDAHLSRFS